MVNAKKNRDSLGRFLVGHESFRKKGVLCSFVCQTCGSVSETRVGTAHALKFCSRRCAAAGRRKWKNESERVASMRASRKRYYLKHKDLWLKYSRKRNKRLSKLRGILPNRSRDEDAFYIQLKKEYRNTLIIRNTRRIIRNPITGYPLELDFFIPSKRLAFEINGIGHRKPVRGGVKKFLDRQRNDRIKAEQCAQLGIDLKIINV